MAEVAFNEVGKVYEGGVQAVNDLPQGRGKVLTWPVVTVFGFIARPDRHLFLKPRVTRKAARVYGFDFGYQPDPSWPVYHGLQTFGAIIRPEVREPAVPLPQMSLKTVPVPKPPAAAIGEYVVDNNAAIQLGKALFWDMHVGSDNQTACATCHFSAGADKRPKNGVNPGTLRRTTDLQLPNPDFSFQLGGPNYTFQAGDFPLTKFLAGTTGNDPAKRTDKNDIASSQGQFNGAFNGTTVDKKAGALADNCSYTLDADAFHYGSLNTRKVQARNAPTVINAAYNFRNFWD